MQGTEAAVGRRRLQARRARLLVQGFHHPSPTTERAVEAKARHHAGAAAGRLQDCAQRAECEAITGGRRDLPDETFANAERRIPTCISGCLLYTSPSPRDR